MISAAQDYMFVSFGAGIAVDGEIMPKRADKSLLRGVDAGFLREAYEERRVAAGGTRASPVDLNGEIRASWLSSVAAGYEDLVSRTVSNSSGRFVKPVQLSARLATSYPPIADYGMDFPVSSLTSNKAAFSSGSRLAGDDVLALFTDAQALRTFLLAGPSYTSEWQTWTMAAQGDESVVSGFNSGYLYVWRSVYQRGGKVATGSKNVSGGALTFRVPAADLVDRCTVLLLVYVYREPANEFNAQSRSCWIPLEASRSGDAYTVGATALYSAATTAMQVTGLYRPAPPTASTSSNSASLTVRADRAYAVCTLTDHTNQET